MGFHWRLWVLLPIMVFHHRLWVSISITVMFCIGDHGFVMAIMGFHWRLWVINGNHGCAIIGDCG